ncbi:MAG TPA: agmatinase, partial [Clostridiales bacterium]|nr:agmatinase [Clostridiales bacterium]
MNSQKTTSSDHLPDLPLLGLQFMNCTASYAQADVILFGAPFDSTASFRPGSRFGPAAMRQDSLSLETYSPYQDYELPADKICDIGDLELPAGSVPAALERIRRAVCQVLDDHKMPVILGGEHLVTLPAIEACQERWPDLCVLHFDAHADLRSDYLGESLSHATVMRRVWDLLGDGRIWQFGIRSGTRDEFLFARDGHVRMNAFSLTGLEAAIGEIGSRPVYLTI